MPSWTSPGFSAVNSLPFQGFQPLPAKQVLGTWLHSGPVGCIRSTVATAEWLLLLEPQPRQVLPGLHRLVSLQPAKGQDPGPPGTKLSQPHVQVNDCLEPLVQPVRDALLNTDLVQVSVQNRPELVDQQLLWPSPQLTGDPAKLPDVFDRQLALLCQELSLSLLGVGPVFKTDP